MCCIALHFALTGLCGGSAQAAQVDSVATVIGLTGKASVLDESDARAVSLLSEIKQDTKVQIDDKASMVIMYMKSNQEYEIQGPAIVQFGPEQPESISGSKPEKRKAPVKPRTSRIEAPRPTFSF